LKPEYNILCYYFRKRKDKHKENEAIQFDFDLNSDAPEEVAQEMVSFVSS